MTSTDLTTPTRIPENAFILKVTDISITSFPFTEDLKDMKIRDDIVCKVVSEGKVDHLDLLIKSGYKLPENIIDFVNFKLGHMQMFKYLEENG